MTSVRRHGLTKIKTIGDSYMAVAGAPEPLEDHCPRAAEAALEMLSKLADHDLKSDPVLGNEEWIDEVGTIQVRIGLHAGPVVAGIVGDQRLQYDVWGDTVNVASRMESTGESGRVQVSEAFAEAMKQTHPTPLSEGEGQGESSLTLIERGEIEVKGKGSMKTYWLEGVA